MKRILGLSLVVISAVSSAIDFGPPVIDRPFVDLAYQITFISGGGIFQCPAAGEISEWRLWARGTGEVTLQMWRPVAGVGYQLLGANTVNVASLGLNTFVVNSGRVAVQSGDVMGFRYNQESAGTRIIAYSQDAGIYGYQWTGWPNPGTNVQVGGIINQSSQLSGLNEQRQYSLAATVVPEPLTAVSLLVGSLAFVRRRRSS